MMLMVVVVKMMIGNKMIGAMMIFMLMVIVLAIMLVIQGEGELGAILAKMVLVLVNITMVLLIRPVPIMKW
jgi:hypothetical protein